MWSFFNTFWAQPGVYLWPALEIAVLWFLIYQALYYLRGARASYVLAGLVVIMVALHLLVGVLQFKVLAWLLDGFGTILAMVVVVIFQPELRRAFAQLGSYAFWQRSRRREVLGEIATAAINMSLRKCGALMIIERRIRMQAIVEDAVHLDIRVNPIILESIFFPNATLHDGAVVIREDRIIAARAILPLTRAENIAKNLGTRHRAAVGISEETDAVAVVVSEETGAISVASQGVLRRRVPGELLEAYLTGLVIGEKDDATLAKELRLNQRPARKYTTGEIKVLNSPAVKEAISQSDDLFLDLPELEERDDD